MSGESSQNKFERGNQILRRADQAGVALLIGFGLVAMVGYFFQQWHTSGGVIDIERAEPQTAEFLVDVNSAEWPELSQLPEIGESLARRIIDARASGGPFLSNEDLQRRVRGIGPKTLAKIRPFLQPHNQ